MKKYILIVALICLCFALSGCGDMIKESDLSYEQEHRIIYSKYAIIKEYDKFYLVYDIDTRIMYQIIDAVYRSGISEYYVNNNNKPEIGIYGYNYKGE